jgi:hypothetical protein
MSKDTDIADSILKKDTNSLGTLFEKLRILKNNLELVVDQKHYSEAQERKLVGHKPVFRSKSFY